jgi:hypothetical protein
MERMAGVGNQLPHGGGSTYEAGGGGISLKELCITLLSRCWPMRRGIGLEQLITHRRRSDTSFTAR